MIERLHSFVSRPRAFVRFAAALAVLAAPFAAPARAQCDLELVYSEDFENGAPGWSLSGNWAMVAFNPTCYPVGTCGHGRIATIKDPGLLGTCRCSAESNVPPFTPCDGELRSPSIALPALLAGHSLRLEFCLYAYTDGSCGQGGGDCNRLIVEGMTHSRTYLFDEDPTSVSACPGPKSSPPYDLSEFAGEIVTLRFVPACVDNEGASDLVIDDLAIVRDGGVPFNYCVAAPNSAGPGAVIGTAGSTSFAQNDFKLTVSGAPSGQFGVFFFGPNTTQVPFGDGFRCVAGQIVRLPPAQLTTPTGTALRLLPFDQPPALGKLVVGSTWHFQFWYRDAAAGNTGFNVTNGLTATICP